MLRKPIDIVPLLSVSAAKMLNGCSPPVLEYVLGSIAGMIDYWESNGLDLDPIEQTVLIESIVASMKPLAEKLQSEVETKVQ